MSEQSNDDIRRLWQEQKEATNMELSIEDIRRRADATASSLMHRNGREFAAAALLVLIFSWYAYLFESVVIRLGCVLTIAAAIFVARQLHLRSTRASQRDRELALPWIQAYRLRLERERDLLASVGWWYVAPFVPGAALFLGGRLLDAPERWIPVSTTAMFVVVGLALIILLNRRASHQRQRQLDELNASSPPHSD